MQQFVRVGTRSIFDCIIASSTPRSFRQLSTRTLRPAVITWQQQLLLRRQFTDDKKPIESATDPSKETSNSPPTPPPTSAASTLETNHDSSPPLPTSLPSTEHSRRSQVSKRFSHLMDNVQSNIFVASRRINDLTGYSGIEALKARITVLEDSLTLAQETVRTSREHYKQTIADRAASQREVNSLLSRKESWTPIDVERFTSLYRSDHGNELAVQEAANKLAESERTAEQSASQLSAAILGRYHEEQIWSDKIRQMSTWGTWGLMGVNVLLFLVFQFGFEPWRRARLVRGFEDKVREALAKEKEAKYAADLTTASAAAPAISHEELKLDAIIAAGIEELEGETEDQKEEPVVDALAACISGDTAGPEDATAIPIPDDEPVQANGTAFDWNKPETWIEHIKDLINERFSDRVVSMTQQDVTILALEGAATGAAILGMIVMILSSR